VTFVLSEAREEKELPEMGMMESRRETVQTGLRLVSLRVPTCDLAFPTHLSA
jgi:hypothetical protein